MYKKVFFIPLIVCSLGTLCAKNADISSNEPIKPVSETIEPNIGMDKKSREEVGALLNKLLSDEYLLYTKTYNYHWNVVGPMFNDLHSFFKEQYEKLQGIVDETAERARMMGVRAFGTMSEFMKNTRLKEEEGVVPADMQMIKNLLADHEAVIRYVRADIDTCAKLNDPVTSHFLECVLLKQEKMAWMLRSYLQK
jgi:starvation-inducible DNA-binding protein